VVVLVVMTLQMPVLR
jgi:hypothetical protein